MTVTEEGFRDSNNSGVHYKIANNFFYYSRGCNWIVVCGVHQLGPTELFLFVSADEPFVKAPVNAVSNDVVFC